MPGRHAVIAKAEELVEVALAHVVQLGAKRQTAADRLPQQLCRNAAIHLFEVAECHAAI